MNMLSKFLLIPLAIMAIACLYLVWEYNLEPYYIIPWVILGAIVFVMSPLIDWWWANRNPPQLDPMVEGFLRKFFPYYSALSIPAKKRFLNRVSLYMLATEFKAMAMEDVPDDIQALIACNVVMLTFGQEDYRLSKYEQIIVYPHPFPSPQFRKTFHSTEHYAEDGVILFSLEQLIPGATQKTKYYNIALHEYAKIFTLTYKDYSYPKFDDSIWEQLEKISGFKTEDVKNFIGLPTLEPLTVSINYFFIFPQQFKNVLPEFYDVFSKIFNQDPMKIDFPVIDVEKQGKGI